MVISAKPLPLTKYGVRHKQHCYIVINVDKSALDVITYLCDSPAKGCEDCVEVFYEWQMVQLHDMICAPKSGVSSNIFASTISSFDR